MSGNSSLSSFDNKDSSAEHLAGKYLTFALGKETYGLQILKVFEIIGLMEITEVPRTPPFVRGVINLRGKIIPVVDLRMKFDLPSKEDTERTCIIVVQIAGEADRITMGIIVDEVCEVVNVTEDRIEPTPSFGADVDTQFILGVGQINNNVTMLLDIDKILSGEEIGIVGQVAH